MLVKQDKSLYERFRHALKTSVFGTGKNERFRHRELSLHAVLGRSERLVSRLSACDRRQ